MSFPKKKKLIAHNYIECVVSKLLSWEFNFPFNGIVTKSVELKLDIFRNLNQKLKRHRQGRTLPPDELLRIPVYYLLTKSLSDCVYISSPVR